MKRAHVGERGANGKMVALKGKFLMPAEADKLLADDLVLISQSGKLYGKDATLFDLGGGFIAWENEEVVMREAGDTAIVTLANNRTRPGTDPARFRVMQVWQRKGVSWKMVAQTSVRIAAE